MDVGGLLHLIILIVVVGLICWALYWFVGFVGLPEPFNKIALVLIALVALIFVITQVLMPLLGSGSGTMRLR